MPTLELSELEAKVLWVILDLRAAYFKYLPSDLAEAEGTLFDKAYRAYRGMPPERAA